jgi:hypothetical protein
MTLARKIHVLEHGLEKSLKELAEVEAALAVRKYPRPIEGGGLERRRMLLVKLIEEIDTKLKELKGVRRCSGRVRIF